MFSKALKHPEDLRSIAFVLTAIALTLGGFFVPLHGALKITWFVTQFVFTYCCCVINHNHTHTPTFTKSSLNRWFGYLLSIAKGHTSTQVVVPHNLNHHVYPGLKEDWSRPALALGSLGIVRLPTYLFRATREMATQRKLPGAPSLPLTAQKQGELEKFALYLYAAVCLLLSWKHFLTFVLPIWILVMLALLSANLIQHDGCDPLSEWEHTRNFTGPIGNWFMFNNGYHTIHHLKPTLHWSLLKTEHTNLIEPHLKSKLEEKSIPGFLIRKYLFTLTQFQIPAPVFESERTDAPRPPKQP